jgi:hypothetical protein
MIKVIIVDDDIEAAKALGFATHLFNDPKALMPHLAALGLV